VTLAEPVRRARRTVHVATLREALRVFLRAPSPRLLVTALVALAALRVVRGDWSWADAAVVAGLVAAQPFTEWVVHRAVLHCPADGGLLDRLAGASHRRHHEDPTDLRSQFIHPRATAGGSALGVLLVLLVPSPPVATGVLTAVALTLTYEWVHFLIHTDHRPRTDAFRRLHRGHRLHHYRNEAFWLGVTGRSGDRLLGTDPDKRDVEVSPTARTALAGLRR
jgi:sterol desaturase/sphingolipid hydroxylase (fatty acid hydroxylase superfamily)